MIEKHGSPASGIAPFGDGPHNPEMCPDWESNLQTFGALDDAQPSEPHWPGLTVLSCFLPFETVELDSLVLLSTLERDDMQVAAQRDAQVIP